MSVLKMMTEDSFYFNLNIPGEKKKKKDIMRVPAGMRWVKNRVAVEVQVQAQWGGLKDLALPQV